MSKVKTYAFYLPQFHPTAENDDWWGKGFTEWRNVAKATPKYAGHSQPRLPADLGFYDLRVPEVRHEQALLARNHGIDGFIYYHYWFEGRRLLNRPFDDLLGDVSTDLPFALCWANEDWRRNWDGYSGEMLMRQTYSRRDHEEHIAWLMKAFADPRYIRFEGKPMFLVYRAARIPDVIEMTKLWRQRAREAGIGELHLCRVESDNDEFENSPQTLGFDAAIEFGVEWRHLGSGQQTNGVNRHDYPNTAQRILSRPEAGYTRHAGVATGFDNTPRKATGIVLDGASPTAYREWLTRTIERELQRNPGASEIPIFVNAWNEWAEGAILEPCALWGNGFLEAHRNALEDIRTGVAASTTLVAPDSAPSLSIVIVTSGGPEQLMTCLNSASSASSNERKVEFVVVDNGSTDETAALIRELGNAVRGLRLDTRVEPNLAWTRGTTTAASNRILCLSNDVMVDDHALQGASGLLEQNEKCPAVRLSLSNGSDTMPSNWLESESGVATLIDLAALRTNRPSDNVIVWNEVVGRRAAPNPVSA